MRKKANRALDGNQGAVQTSKRCHDLQFENFSTTRRQTLARCQGAFGSSYTRDGTQPKPGAIIPFIDALKQYRDNNDVWTVTIRDVGDVVVRTAALSSYSRFRHAVFCQRGVVLAPMRINAWYDILDRALAPLRGEAL